MGGKRRVRAEAAAKHERGLLCHRCHSQTDVSVCSSCGAYFHTGDQSGALEMCGTCTQDEQPDDGQGEG